MSGPWENIFEFQKCLIYCYLCLSLLWVGFKKFLQNLVAVLFLYSFLYCAQIYSNYPMWSYVPWTWSDFLRLHFLLLVSLILSVGLKLFEWMSLFLYSIILYPLFFPVLWSDILKDTLCDHMFCGLLSLSLPCLASRMTFMAWTKKMVLCGF